ncbi:MAG: hypothetical protein IKN42_01125 [Elusimicrobia bacterium]|nr:hypothetical protein [Elusimicrobiota bacterium]
MKKTLYSFLFCVLCFSSCGLIDNNNEEIADEPQIEEIVDYERTNKDDAKDLAIEAKKEYEINRNFEKAIELFEKAIEIDSEEEWIYADMARTKMEIRDYNGAIEDLKKAMELKEKNDLNNTEEEK